VNVLVTGAAGLVGGPLAAMCEGAGHTVVRAGRRARDAHWLAWDMSRPWPGRPPAPDCLLHTAPLWLLPGQLAPLARAGMKRVVCFGSTSVFTKQASADRGERSLAAALADAEAGVWRESGRHAIAATLLRPTLVYGYGRDANVTAIAGFVRRFGFFPVSGRASGRRQPVHAGDLAGAAMAVLSAPVTVGRSYEVVGGETLTYRDMVARIFQGLGRRPRIITLPPILLRGLFAAASALKPGITASMADRMNDDLVFDDSAARRDFGFDAEGFLMHPQRDLVTS